MLLPNNIRSCGFFIPEHCPRHTRQWGVTLIELAVVMLIIMLMLGLGSLISRGALERSQIADNEQQLALAVSQVLRFVIANNRLPCPDVDGNGLEQCAAVGSPGDAEMFGRLPFRTLGLSTGVLDAGAQPLLYGANPLLQQPDIVNLAYWDFPSASQDRFCEAMSTRMALDAGTGAVPFAGGEPTVASADMFAANGLGSCAVADGAYNPAIIVISTGITDADNDGNRFDQRNSLIDGDFGSVPRCVESPNRALSARYDDQVRAIGFPELYGMICAGGRDPVADAVWNDIWNGVVTP